MHLYVLTCTMITDVAAWKVEKGIGSATIHDYNIIMKGGKALQMASL